MSLGFILLFEHKTMNLLLAKCSARFILDLLGPGSNRPLFGDLRCTRPSDRVFRMNYCCASATLELLRRLERDAGTITCRGRGCARWDGTGRGGGRGGETLALGWRDGAGDVDMFRKMKKKE